MRKPLNARSTKFVKIQTSARATLGANPASSASRHPIRRPFSPAHGVSLSTRHCGSARAGQTHPLRVNAPTRVKHQAVDGHGDDLDIGKPHLAVVRTIFAPRDAHSSASSRVSSEASRNRPHESFFIARAPGSDLSEVLANANSDAISFATLLNCAGCTTVTCDGQLTVTRVDYPMGGTPHAQTCAYACVCAYARIGV
jgi:hypothetical protein